ncbi:MAG: YkgJ family cysteine cluster protein [Myxococcales bacterium]|nr:YkgJ family cysteine cluster protein [Myxococcales bacterium]
MSEEVSGDWFASGLAFRCTGCGDCCTGAPGFVWVNSEEVAQLAAQLGVEPAEVERRYVRRVGSRRSLMERTNGDCIFFDHEARTCSVYEARPTQCRSYPFWDALIETPEAWQAMTGECEGAREPGPLITVEAIRARAREHRTARDLPLVSMDAGD